MRYPTRRSRGDSLRMPLNSHVHLHMTPKESTSSASRWTPDLDALVAAPEQHRLLLENARVRVLDTQIAPGGCTPVHTHRWPAVHYIISWSAFVRRDAEGTVLVDTRASGSLQSPPPVLWGEPLAPHSLENVGPTPLHVISVELKAQLEVPGSSVAEERRP